MSGGCCSPFGPGPSTPVFYQTVLDSTGTAKPQEAALKFSADFTETDVPGVATLLALRSPISPTIGVSPFKGDYFADPAFVGTSTGSQSNPFTSITAAFAAMVTAGLPGGTVWIPAATTVTENIVFPDTAGKWEIACYQSLILSSSGGSARINGTITCTSTQAGTTAFALTNLFLNGNISGNASAGLSLLFMCNVRQQGSVTTTTSGTGVWLGVFKGTAAAVPSKVGGSHTALVSIAGSVYGINWVFEGGITEAPASGTFNPPVGTTIRGCQFGSVNGVAVPIGLNGNDLVAGFSDCTFVGPTTFTAANANYVVSVDAASMASLLSVGVTLVGTGISLKTLDSNASRISTETGNRASTALGARAPADLYEMVSSSTLLAQGTNGLYQPNAIYTDMTGTLVTVPVGNSLDITAAVGTKASGSLQFQHNGAAAPLAFSTTGIVTPGAVSIALALSVKRRS